jgi:magnesium chelatase subunit I
MVDLPLGATEDRVCGTLILKSLTEGIKAFEPGLCLKQIVDFLYVDVNLLDDHLVDILLILQLLAGILEREGISIVSHVSISVSQNPEGENYVHNY